MNTDNFDKHAKANLAFYEGFMNFSKIVMAAIAVTLIAMAIFLLQPLTNHRNKKGRSIMMTERPFLLGYERGELAYDFIFCEEMCNFDSCIFKAI